MKCEKCGKETDSVLVGMFNHDGSDSDIKVPALNADENAAIMDVTQNWTGYELSEDEQRDTIKCPHCNQFPFKNGEIQVYDIVRIVCFKEEEHNETD